MNATLDSIQSGRIEVNSLSAEEQLLTFNYPNELGDGERHAIALAQTRKATLLSNDERAIRYCLQKGISRLDLVDVLRLLWSQRVMTQDELRSLIEKLENAEGLNLPSAEQAAVFNPQK